MPKTIVNVAVLPLVGPISHRPGFFQEFFGGVSTIQWGRAFDDLMAAKDVSTIILDIDSPGGVVSGTVELANKIYSARSKKRIIAVANTWMASAAYFIGSQAHELAITPSGEVGSIGVRAMHVDVSEALRKAGQRISVITSAKRKAETDPYAPLSPEARKELQAGVNYYHGQFVDAVARGRGVSRATVNRDFGEGAMLRPPTAIAVGAADSVATLEDVIDREMGARSRSEADRAQRSRRASYLEAVAENERYRAEHRNRMAEIEKLEREVGLN
jgi:signal peptide peptidase SppA